MRRYWSIHTVLENYIKSHIGGREVYSLQLTRHTEDANTNRDEQWSYGTVSLLNFVFLLLACLHAPSFTVTMFHLCDTYPHAGLLTSELQNDIPEVSWAVTSTPCVTMTLRHSTCPFAAARWKLQREEETQILRSHHLRFTSNKALLRHAHSLSSELHGNTPRPKWASQVGIVINLTVKTRSLIWAPWQPSKTKAGAIVNLTVKTRDSEGSDCLLIYTFSRCWGLNLEWRITTEPHTPVNHCRLLWVDVAGNQSWAFQLKDEALWKVRFTSYLSLSPPRAEILNRKSSPFSLLSTACNESIFLKQYILLSHTVVSLEKAKYAAVL